MTSRGFNDDGGQDDVKGVIVVQGWVVRKARIRGFITTSDIRTESDHDAVLVEYWPKMHVASIVGINLQAGGMPRGGTLRYASCNRVTFRENQCTGN